MKDLFNVFIILSGIACSTFVSGATVPPPERVEEFLRKNDSTFPRNSDHLLSGTADFEYSGVAWTLHVDPRDYFAYSNKDKGFVEAVHSPAGVTRNPYTGGVWDREHDRLWVIYNFGQETIKLHLVGIPKNVKGNAQPGLNEFNNYEYKANDNKPSDITFEVEQNTAKKAESSSTSSSTSSASSVELSSISKDPSKIELVLTSNLGHRTKIRVKKTCTILEFKFQIQDAEGISLSRQFLYKREKPNDLKADMLDINDDNKTIADFNLKDGDEIKMFIRLPGSKPLILNK